MMNELRLQPLYTTTFRFVFKCRFQIVPRVEGNILKTISKRVTPETL